MKKTAIGERINAFIAYKRSLGYVYDTQERYLKHYQRHMEENFSWLGRKPAPDIRFPASFCLGYHKPLGKRRNRCKCHDSLPDAVYGAQLYETYLVLLQIRARFLCGL